MRKIKLISSLLVIVFILSFINITLGSRHFIQMGNKVYASGWYCYYNKYQVDYTWSSEKSNIYNAVSGSFYILSRGQYDTDYAQYTGIQNIYWDAVQGRYVGDADTFSIHAWELSSSKAYRFDSGSKYFIPSGSTLGSYYAAGNEYFRYYGTETYRSKVVPCQGSLVQSNIQVSEGTYPNNGKHTDGYWYVKVTTIPQITTTAPSQNGTLFLSLHHKKQMNNYLHNRIL